MKSLRNLAIIILLVLSSFAKLPSLTNNEAQEKIKEILSLHAQHRSITPEIAQRALSNFLLQLDPAKTYFLESEVKEWDNASEYTLFEVIDGVNSADFTIFEEIYNQFIPTINRREALEKRIDGAKLPKDVKSSEFKDMGWAKDESTLFERLKRIKALQVESAEKLDDPKVRKTFEKRLLKRRLKREEEFKETIHRKPHVLTLAIKSIAGALDSQTAYFTPAEAHQFMIQVQQSLVGIGAMLRDDLNGFSIVQLVEGGPAQRSGKLHLNDRIIAVNNEPVVGMEITEAVELIRGKVNTKVNLTIVRKKEESEETFDISLVRKEVVVEEGRTAERIEPYGDGVIAHLSLFSFYQDSKHSSASDLATMLGRIKNEYNLKGVVLDLRNNGGGLLTQANKVCSLFVKRGITVSVKDYNQRVEHLRNFNDKVEWDGPLLVLINHASASASEIVAGTLQDYGRALIVGSQSFGKGSFQSVSINCSRDCTINPKGEYKVTQGRYYTASGESPQLVGITPDIVVPGIYEGSEVGERFLKYPLGKDCIGSNCVDNLSDIPFEARKRFRKLYKTEMQEVETTYQPFIPTLKKNAQLRMEQNKRFQSFLKLLRSDDPDFEALEGYSQTDFQLQESYNVMKDYLYLNRQN